MRRLKARFILLFFCGRCVWLALGCSRMFLLPFGDLALFRMARCMSISILISPGIQDTPLVQKHGSFFHYFFKLFPLLHLFLFLYLGLWRFTPHRACVCSSVLSFLFCFSNLSFHSWLPLCYLGSALWIWFSDWSFWILLVCCIDHQSFNSFTEL